MAAARPGATQNRSRELSVSCSLFADTVQAFMVNPDTGIPQIHGVEALSAMDLVLCKSSAWANSRSRYARVLS